MGFHGVRSQNDTAERIPPGAMSNTGFTSPDVLPGIASEADFGVTSNGTYQIRVKAYSGSYIGLESVTTIVISGF